ncbi:WXG100 family type VII secretion target [Amycolatopsis sp. CA-230715]|uniref:WXG100 family type VII secretion target n=1 Tax=Amycolatopsis sp. CA-230715 TaxID=2745196 RepID=UPI001C036795|nr:hypothetical protein [Amycolatopsis sp. CA-230715]QWF80952.1 hypothetical protein HUW46_04377 [Amycolatopsis sp. CA-230715]
MTAPAPALGQTSGQASDQVDITQTLGDLDSTLTAVQSEDWVTAGLSGATTAADLLGSGSDPLSGIVNAGFGWLTGLVDFLAAPLKTLAGDPSSMSSSAQDLHGTGKSLSSHADSYQQAATKETGNWSGEAASGYQNTSGKLADQLRAISKASAGVSSAMSGANKVVGQAQQIVTQLVGEASGEINTIMLQAMAAAQVTGGASVAAAIPQCVQVATRYGGQIAEKMGALLSSGQNLTTLLLGVVKALEVVDQAITKTTGKGSATGSGGSASQGSGSGGSTGSPTSSGTPGSSASSASSASSVSDGSSGAADSSGAPTGTPGSQASAGKPGTTEDQSVPANA